LTTSAPISEAFVLGPALSPLLSSQSPNRSPADSPSDNEDDIPALMSPEDLPVKLCPSKLTFGDELVTVDVENVDSFSLVNRSATDCRFRFLPQKSMKYTLHFEPLEGVVKALKAKKIKVKITLHCTTKLAFDVVVLLWSQPSQVPKKPQRKHSASFGAYTAFKPTKLTTELKPPASESILESLRLGAAAKLALLIESEPSAKLNGEEVFISAPAVGDGSFGTVYRGLYRGQDVAVKVLKNQDEWMQSTKHMEDFQREVGIMERLKHPCIVRFIGGIHKPGDLAIVTEFCPLGNLSDFLKKHQGSLSPECKLRVKFALDCARGMAYLHGCNVIHRDLKPKNILVVSPEADSEVCCKISDFGSVKVLTPGGSGSSAEMTQGVGSVKWMAPEVMQHHSYGRSCDIFSFSIILYEAVCGIRPYIHEDRTFWQSQEIAKFIVSGQRLPLPKHCSSIISRMIRDCWQQDPNKRPEFDDLVPVLEVLLCAAESDS